MKYKFLIEALFILSLVSINTAFSQSLVAPDKALVMKTGYGYRTDHDPRIPPGTYLRYYGGRWWIDHHPDW